MVLVPFAETKVTRLQGRNPAYKFPFKKNQPGFPIKNVGNDGMGNG